MLRKQKLALMLRVGCLSWRSQISQVEKGRLESFEAHESQLRGISWKERMEG